MGIPVHFSGTKSYPAASKNRCHLPAEFKPTDAEIIQSVVAGEVQAYGQLVARYQDRLLNSLFRITGSREEAEDVAQESFVQAFAKLSSFKGKSQFYTWLYRIAFNTSISRKRRKRPTISADRVREDTGMEPTDTAASACDQIEQQERVDAVHDALNELSDEYRQIIVLRELEECSYDTIAEILDMPVGTVRSRLHRARVQLKDILQRNEQFS